MTGITKESLEKFGMTTDTDSPISPAKKVLHENDGDAKITLAITSYRNTDEFAWIYVIRDNFGIDIKIKSADQINLDL